MARRQPVNVSVLPEEREIFRALQALRGGISLSELLRQLGREEQARLRAAGAWPEPGRPADESAAPRGARAGGRGRSRASQERAPTGAAPASRSRGTPAPSEPASTT